jgi:hypothetical protein
LANSWPLHALLCLFIASLATASKDVSKPQ